MLHLTFSFGSFWSKTAYIAHVHCIAVSKSLHFVDEDRPLGRNKSSNIHRQSKQQGRWQIDGPRNLYLKHFGQLVACRSHLFVFVLAVVFSVDCCVSCAFSMIIHIVLVGDMADHGCRVVSSFNFVVCWRCKMNGGLRFLPDFSRTQSFLLKNLNPDSRNQDHQII